MVYQQGKRWNSSHLALRTYPRRPSALPLEGVKQSALNSREPPRIGISISQKVSKRAVVRNRIKRQLRAILRGLLPHLQPGWDLVIVVRPTAVECDYQQFLQELKQLLSEAEILHGY